MKLQGKNRILKSSAGVRTAQRPIMIVDGLNIFIRHFMVNESVNGKSEPIGGVVGFIRFLNMAIQQWAPEKCIVVWENGGPSNRRKKISPTYKAGRKKIKDFKKTKTGTATMKDQLRLDTKTKVTQLATIFKFLKLTPVCQIFIKDTECDDIVAYLAKYYYRSNPDQMKMIFSSDKDFYQLLERDDIQIYDPARKITIDKAFVQEKYNISPNNFCLARAFDGDPSDNIEGVPGVGLKSLVKRFPGFGDENRDMTIEDVLTESKNILKENKKLKQMKEILECEDLLKTNWKLMYFNTSNLAAYQIEKIQGTLEQHETKLDKLGMIKFLSKEQMNMSFDFDNFCLNLNQYLIRK